ncbi:hypothetical protein BDI4_350069 [Burkholderia diffusa]|nr:hypothetical protein BDI4_350069 [Burkholderia diffusa]
MSVPSPTRHWCAAAHSCRPHFGTYPLDEFVYFALLSNARPRGILFADMARNPRGFSVSG